MPTKQSANGEQPVDQDADRSSDVRHMSENAPQPEYVGAVFECALFGLIE